MTDSTEDLKDALYRVVTAIVTLESTEGVRSREAYSELVAATSHAKKVLHEHGLSIADAVNLKAYAARTMSSVGPSLHVSHGSPAAPFCL